MGKYASGKRALAISDRSGMAFPYTEMVREWNGSLVHTSEFEAKQPQLSPKLCNLPSLSSLQVGHEEDRRKSERQASRRHGQRSGPRQGRQGQLRRVCQGPREQDLIDVVVGKNHDSNHPFPTSNVSFEETAFYGPRLKF